MERQPYKTEFGVGWVVTDGERLVATVLPNGPKPEGTDGGNRAIAEQLELYYEGNVSWLPWPALGESAGTTPFMRRIYDVVSRIRPGEVMTYGEVAAAAGRPGAGRAVGSAMARNPFPPIIPCHRVVAANGGLGGYAGGVEMKRQMLRREGVAHD